LVFEDALPLTETTALPAADGHVDAMQPYATARRRALDQFERSYLQSLLALHQGKVTHAAAAAEMDRVYFSRLLRRTGIKPGNPDGRSGSEPTAPSPNVVNATVSGSRGQATRDTDLAS